MQQFIKYPPTYWLLAGLIGLAACTSDEQQTNSSSAAETAPLTVTPEVSEKATSVQKVDSVQLAAINQWQAMRFGLFIHWGVYSIPAGVWEGKQIEKLGEQIQRHADISHADYMALASQFNPVNFDADAVVKMAKDAGMRYIVLTAKHHDGFAMFDSKVTDFDIVDFTPYGKDILKQLADATAKHGLKLGVYYSTPDWHFNGPHPERNPADGKLSVFSKVSKANEDFQVAQLQELMTHYGDIVEVFFDMGEPTLAQSLRFRAAVKELQPKALINGRVMNNQGDFLTMPDNHVPDVPITEYPWEMPGTFYHTWGYKSWVKGDPLPEQIKNQVRKLSSLASMGGNFLLNVGPKADGSIPEYERQVLAGLGKWVNVYKEAIFDTGLNPFNQLPWGMASTGKQKLYLHIYNWPETQQLIVPGLRNTITRAYSLAHKNIALAVTDTEENQFIDLRLMQQDPNLSIVVLEYEGVLDIVPVHAVADQQGVIELLGDAATKHGKYGRESYRSLLKDFYRSWYVDVPAPGSYDVEISYKLRYDSKDFIVEAGAQPLAISLQGNGKKDEQAQLIDGNEIDEKSTSIGGGYRRITLAGLVFDAAGVQPLILRQGKPFELKATVAEFHAQDHKYRSMNIEIAKIRLVPTLTTGNNHKQSQTIRNSQ